MSWGLEKSYSALLILSFTFWFFSSFCFKLVLFLFDSEKLLNIAWSALIACIEWPIRMAGSIFLPATQMITVEAVASCEVFAVNMTAVSDLQNTDSIPLLLLQLFLNDKVLV